MSDATETTSPLLRPRTAARALVVGAAALLVCAVGLIFDREAVARSYLTAFVFVNSIPLGCLAVVMLHHLTGGVWGAPVRRIAEAGAMTAPLMAVLFVPVVIAFWTGHLYPWANPAEYAHEAVVRHRRELPVLGFSAGWVVARAAVYFAVWTALAWRLRAGSLRQDSTLDRAGQARRLTGGLASLSGAGSVLYFVTASLAASDWVMSREAHYYSSVFGFIAVAAQSIAGVCFALVILRFLADRSAEKTVDGESRGEEHGPLAGRLNGVAGGVDAVATPRALQDVGNLLLTCVILWSYVSFAQLLVNWVGNTQEDVTWYVHRSHGGWRVVTIGLIVLHFFVPFALLLFQPVKRNLRPLARLAAGLLVLRLVDAFWTTAPSSPTDAAGGLYWTDLFAPIGVGGVWLAGFLWVLRRAPVVIAVSNESAAPDAPAGGRDVSLSPP
jgi:hypothetical protein